jgi:hypothetical protein
LMFDERISMYLSISECVISFYFYDLKEKNFAKH